MWETGRPEEVFIDYNTVSVDSNRNSVSVGRNFNFFNGGSGHSEVFWR